MKSLIILAYLIQGLNSNQEVDYANCLWNNCRDLREKCDQACAVTAEVVQIMQSSEYCVTGKDRVLYYKTCAGLIANATTGDVQLYYKCLENCFSAILGIALLIYIF
ncbi:unnamed protein product [Paramecium sonneborni]|uniref:Uncharacterized protein n=1 Tax=Paramecium sonneborni TaxID=65129 RepID=A0A8S1LM87_9CILI|nr:unnamed protein product [Paramecium sonneborni]